MSSNTTDTPPFDPTNVDLTSADPTEIICFLSATENEYNGQLGARVSALFVILILSTAVTFFPVLSTRVPKLKIPIYVYLFARYFGAGVIIATAVIQCVPPSLPIVLPSAGATAGTLNCSC
jgi:zinc transporter 1/2/3